MKMKYLVTKNLGKGQLHEVATFVRRWEAEKYAMQESGLSGFAYLVEELGQDDSLKLLTTFRDGEELRRVVA
jgi:hypothetical protein